MVNYLYNFSIQNYCSKKSDRVQFRFQSPERCIMKHLKNTKLYAIEFSRTEMTSDPSDYHREYSSDRSYSLFQFQNLNRVQNFVFFTCLMVTLCRHLEPTCESDSYTLRHSKVSTVKPATKKLVGSMEAPSKAFLLSFLLPDWLKLNRLKS